MSTDPLPAALRAIASEVHGRAVALAVGLTGEGLTLASDLFFDTVTVEVTDAASIVAAACDEGVWNAAACTD